MIHFCKNIISIDWLLISVILLQNLKVSLIFSFLMFNLDITIGYNQGLPVVIARIQPTVGSRAVHSESRDRAFSAQLMHGHVTQNARHVIQPLAGCAQSQTV